MIPPMNRGLIISPFPFQQRARICYFKCIIEAFRYMLRRSGLSREQTKQMAFATRRAMLSMVETDLKALPTYERRRRVGILTCFVVDMCYLASAV